MKKKDTVLLIAASVFCVITAVISALTFGVSDGQILHRDTTNSFEASFQTEQGAYVSAVFGSEDNASAGSPSDVPIPEYTVNLNTASEYELAALLPGIGEKKAAAIVEFREIRGNFKSVDELIEVEGISSKLLEIIRPYCVIDSSDDQ